MTTKTMTLRERFEDAMKFVDATGLPQERFTLSISDYQHDVQVHPHSYPHEDHSEDCLAAIKRQRGEPTSVERDRERMVDWYKWDTSYDSTRLRVVMGVSVPR